MTKNSAGTHLLPSEAQNAAETACQIVTVRHIEGSKAALTYFKRECGGWTQVFSCEANLGKCGIGKTREGDMKTPLGTFVLSTPFGILPDPSLSDPAGRTASGYLQLTDDHYWCGQNGPFYNRLIDNSNPPEGYHPTGDDERLIRYSPAYHYGMFIEYNKEGAPSLGSAIFLHCTSGSPYTAGCVAIAEEYMRELILELGPNAVIVIYQ